MRQLFVKKPFFAACLTCAAIMFLCAPSALNAGPPQAMTLIVGEETVIPVTDANRVTVDRANIIALKPVSKTDLRIEAVAPGATRLNWTDAGGEIKSLTVHVMPSLSGFAKEVSDLLADVPNAKVAAVGNRVVVDGKLITLEDIDRVDRIAKAYGEKLLNLTVFDRGPSNEVVAEFIRKISGVDTVNVNVVGQTAYLSGYVFGQTARSNVLTLAKAQVANVVDMIQVRDIMIETEVIFVKLTESGGSDIGMNLLDGGEALSIKVGASGDASRKSDRGTEGDWSSTWTKPPYSYSTSGGQSSSDSDSRVSNLGVQWSVDILPRLNILVSDGKASILARPRISTKNGETGRFHSGGEFYYEVSGVQAADLKNVEYGFQLSVRPEMVSDDKISNTISIEVSVPIGKAGSEQLNLDKFQVQNTVICELGQSIIVSGFSQNMGNYTRARTPILGDIPFIGFFFSRRVRSNQDEQLAAIITPRLLYHSAPRDAYMAMPQNIRETYDESAFFGDPAADHKDQPADGEAADR